MLTTIDSSEELNEKIKELDEIFKHLPCVVILHDLKKRGVAYMSENGLKQLGVSMEELATLTSEEYFERYFNQEDIHDYLPKIIELLTKNNDDEILTHFQHVKFKGDNDWRWHMSSVRIFMRDSAGQPSVLITHATPIDAMHHMSAKATKLHEENNFLRNNVNNYAKLTKREREILTLIALGKSATEIANELFIAIATAETHRKNIKQKLNAGTYELMKYARAFDLI